MDNNKKENRKQSFPMKNKKSQKTENVLALSAYWICIEAQQSELPTKLFPLLLYLQVHTYD